MRLRLACLVLGTSVLSAEATTVPITGVKLVVVDKKATAGSAKMVFVARDATVTKADGTDPAQIQSTLRIKYDGNGGAFGMPAGGAWLTNSFTVAKYVNKDAPSGGATKLGLVKRNLLTKVVGKELGDTPLDVSSAPTGAVYVAQTIVNGPQVRVLCTQFDGCVHKEIAGGTGYKLVCQGNSTPDPACQAIDQCRTGLCDPVTGECGKAPDGTTCDDGVFCTQDDFCIDGVCAGGAPRVCPQGVNECLVAHCDTETDACDGYQIECPESPDPCFAIECQGNDGICRSQFVGDPRDCETANACDTHDDCADNDPCTFDECLLDGASRVCHYTFMDGDIFCNDNNPCTNDICNPANDDGNPVGCEHFAVNPAEFCDDSVACTIERCVDPSGCGSEASDAACTDDEDPCTAPPVCDPQDAAAGQDGCVLAQVCDDGDPCTQDVCTVDAKDGVSCSYVALNCST